VNESAKLVEGNKLYEKPQVVDYGDLTALTANIQFCLEEDGAAKNIPIHHSGFCPIP
jgi:hypothetical protein